MIDAKELIAFWFAYSAPDGGWMMKLRDGTVATFTPPYAVRVSIPHPAEVLRRRRYESKKTRAEWAVIRAEALAIHRDCPLLDCETIGAQIGTYGENVRRWIRAEEKRASTPDTPS